MPAHLLERYRAGLGVKTGTRGGGVTFVWRPPALLLADFWRV